MNETIKALKAERDDYHRKACEIADQRDRADEGLRSAQKQLTDVTRELAQKTAALILTTELRKRSEAEAAKLKAEYGSMHQYAIDTRLRAEKAEAELADMRSVNRYHRGHSEGYKEAEEKYATKLGEMDALRSKAEAESHGFRTSRDSWKEWAEEARAMYHKQIDATAMLALARDKAEAELSTLRLQFADVQQRLETSLEDVARDGTALAKIKEELREQKNFYGDISAVHTARARVAELERDIADITEIWGHQITDYLVARHEQLARETPTNPTP